MQAASLKSAPFWAWRLQIAAKLSLSLLNSKNKEHWGKQYFDGNSLYVDISGFVCDWIELNPNAREEQGAVLPSAPRAAVYASI